jgi:hypothetical protein
MPYTWINFAQLKAELLNRLEDTAGVFWTDAEVGLYIQEALRTWQAYTRCWRDRMTFQTAANTAYYDLTAQAATLLPFTVKDQDLISVMMYQLLEPQFAAGAYIGSAMFNQASIVNALQHRRDEFLLKTGMVTNQALINGPAPGNGRLALDDKTIGIIRSAWLDSTDNKYNTVWRADEWGGEAFLAGWAHTPIKKPQTVSIAAVPPVTLQLIPPNMNPGKLDLIRIFAGAALDPVAGVLMGVPDDFAWVVKWGAMADLLGRQGESIDAQRAEYCEARWQEGLAIARQFTSIVVSYIEGVQVFPSSIAELDMYRPGWQNDTHKQPEVLAIASWNMLVTAPVPDAGPYSVMLDVVRNAPVPSINTDKIQLGREEIEAILDYGEHLAAFKQGGDDFMASGQQYSNVVEMAKNRNDRLKAGIPFYIPLLEQPERQEDVAPTQQKE